MHPTVHENLRRTLEIYYRLAVVKAAALLDRMMDGETVGAEAILVKPFGVETRQSTDILAIEDPDVAAAVRFIRENAMSGINVGDILRKVPIAQAMERGQARIQRDRYV
jgi:hypothetical protein